MSIFNIHVNLFFLTHHKMKNIILIRLEQLLIFVCIRKKFKYIHMLNNNSIEHFIIVKGIFRGIHQLF